MIEWKRRRNDKSSTVLEQKSGIDHENSTIVNQKGHAKNYPGKPWYRRGLFLGLGIFAIVIFVMWLMINPVADYFARRAFDNLQGYKGTYKDVSIGVIPPQAEITNLELIKDPSTEGGEFIIFTERAQLNVLWKKLFKGALVMRVNIDHPKLTIIQEPIPPKPPKPPEVKKPPPKIPDVKEQLKKAPPARIDHIEVNNAEIIFVDATERSKPRFWIHDMGVRIQNIATREKLAKGVPTTVSANGVVQKSGDLRFFLTANPWEKGLSFSGETELKGLALPDLYEFATAKADIKPIRGTFDLFTSFNAKGNEITGGIKPVLHNVDVAPEDSTFLNQLKSTVVNVTVSVLSGSPDQPEEGEKLATIIPIKGTVTDPNPQIVPTVLGIIRNAFVEGLQVGFQNLPPPTAPKKEGVVEQVIKALTPEEGPPKAQPEGDEGKKE